MKLLEKMSNMKFIWCVALLLHLHLIGVTDATPLPSIAGCPFDLVFVIDGSGSICRNLDVPTCDNWETTKTFMNQIVDHYYSDITSGLGRVAVVQFGNSAQVRWNLDSYFNINQLKSAISGLAYNSMQNTNTYGGLNLMRTVVFSQARSNVAKIAIVITDGKPTMDQYPMNADLDRELIEDRSVGILIFAVGVTSSVDDATLAKLSATSSNTPGTKDDNYFIEDSYANVDNALAGRITQAILPYCRSAVTTATPAPCGIESKVMDLVFLLDDSGSICDNSANYIYGVDKTCSNWKSAIDFIIAIINKLSIGPLDTRVGMVHFDTNATVDWGLDRYTYSNDLTPAINNLKDKYNGGTTDTTDALMLARTRVFNQNGDRGDVRNVVVIVTDGNPNEKMDTLSQEITALQSISRVFAVGVTNLINENMLANLSSANHTKNIDYFTAANYSVLDTLVQQLTNAIQCNAILTTPKPVCNPNQLLDLALVLDDSGSICDTEGDYKFGSDTTCSNWKSALNFAVNIVNGLNIGPSYARVGMVHFDTNAAVDWYLNTYTDSSSLTNAIRNLPYHGGFTDTTDALDLTLNQIFSSAFYRPGANRAAVIITDGNPNMNMSTLDQKISAIHSTNIQVYVVGVTNRINENMLMELSSAPHLPNQNYFMSTDYSNVGALVPSLLQSVCNTPTPPCTGVNLIPPDLVFVLDTSGSICNNPPSSITTCDNWKFILQFVHNIVSNMNIGPTATMVGMVQFANSGTFDWNLSRYSDKASLLNAIDNLPYIGGTTDTTAGLRVMRTQVFGQAGDRPNYPNKAVVITDGIPTEEMDALPGEINAVQNAGIKVFVVGVTNLIDENTLRSLSSPPHQLNTNYFIARDYSSVDSVRAQLVESVNECDRSTSTAPPTVTACVGGSQPDIVFVLDDSGSICNNQQVSWCANWQFLVTFVYNLVSYMNIGTSATMVGLVHFDSNAAVNWMLNSYTDKNSLLSAINSLANTYKGGDTDTTAGLRMMRTQVFSQSGDRPSHPNYAVLITDGEPTVEVNGLQDELDQLRMAGIKVFVVGVTNQVNETIVRMLSSWPQLPNQNYFLATDYSTVNVVQAQLIPKLCNSRRRRR